MPAKNRVLWICSDPASPSDLTALDRLHNVTHERAASPPEAFEHMSATRFDVVMANFPLADWTPAELVEEAQRIDPLVPVMIRDPQGTLADAVRLAKRGVEQYCTELPDESELARQIEVAAGNSRRRRLARGGIGPSGGLDEPWKQLLVGQSHAMREIEELVRLVSSRRSTVLITGETGTGKEMVARALHMAGPRARQPMVAVNCSALPLELLEAELFGHVRGAFTGAIQNRVGRFEQAQGGTLFLDEIGDMPLELQAKILRVLQSREFQRLGSSDTVQVDVRCIAATNLDLAEQVRRGSFREDLYYRLNVVPIQVPPLRERLSDIPLLVCHFLEKICQIEEIPPKQVSEDVLDRLSGYPWPGNVRQLENAVEMAVALSGDRKMLYPSDFPLPCGAQRRAAEPGVIPMVALPDDGLDFERTIDRIERSILDQALRKAGGNKKAAADMLRLKRTTLSAKLRSLAPAS